MLGLIRRERTPQPVNEERKACFLTALRELHERKPLGHSGPFELPEIAQYASRRDPDYDPSTFADKIAGIFDLDPIPNPKREARERSYLGKRGEARSIIGQLVASGEVEAAPIAALCLDGAVTYGRNPNQDGMLYRLAVNAEPAAKPTAESAAY